MKYQSFNVEFQSPEREIKELLQKQGAYNIDVRRSYRGDEMEVRYIIKCINPKKDIEDVLKEDGAKNINISENWNGARVTYQLDDIISEQEFSRRVREKLRKKGYRGY